MLDRLQHLIHLINKTGDKIVFFDQYHSDNCFVISSLKSYENTVEKVDNVKDLTEDELIDKINRDIAIWKNSQVQGSEFSDFSSEYTENKEDMNHKSASTWSPPKASFERPSTSKNLWKIPESRRREADSIN